MGFYSWFVALRGACAKVAAKLGPSVVFTALVVLAAQDAQPPLAVRYHIAKGKEAAGLKLQVHDKVALLEARIIGSVIRAVR